MLYTTTACFVGLSTFLLLNGMFALVSSTCDLDPCLNGGSCIRVNLTDFPNTLEEPRRKRDIPMAGAVEDFICECTGGYSGRTCTDIFDTCDFPSYWQNRSWNDIRITSSTLMAGRCTRPVNVYKTALYTSWIISSIETIANSWSCHLKVGNIYVLRGHNTVYVDGNASYIYAGWDAGLSNQLTDDCLIPFYYDRTVLTVADRFREGFVVYDHLVTNMSLVVNNQLSTTDEYHVLLNRADGVLEDVPETTTVTTTVTTTTATTTTTTTPTTTTTAQTTTAGSCNGSSRIKDLNWTMKIFILASAVWTILKNLATLTMKSY